METTRRMAALAGLAAAAALTAAPTAHAAEQWNDGVYQSSTYTQCVLDVTEIGASAWTGYLADPAQPPKPGQVFYAHAEFGAATSACDGDQHAELDVVPPPGVSLAVDRDHPIQCFYYDDPGNVVADPTCPTHSVSGTWGPQLPAGDGGAAWDLPPGRTLVVDFPLRSSRVLRGPAGGNCPESVDDLPSSSRRDCLIAAVHVLDGDTDPWLAPDVQLYSGRGAVTPALALPAGQRLRSVARKRALAVRCTGPAGGRCRVRATVAKRAARKLHLRSSVLASAAKRVPAAGQATVRLRLSRATARALGHAHALRVTLTATEGTARVTRRVTLRR